MKYFIDKQGGRHIHLKDCPMVSDPRFHYEEIELERVPKMWIAVLIDGKKYVPCPACFGKTLNNPKREK